MILQCYNSSVMKCKYYSYARTKWALSINENEYFKSVRALEANTYTDVTDFSYF